MKPRRLWQGSLLIALPCAYWPILRDVFRAESGLERIALLTALTLGVLVEWLTQLEELLKPDA